MKRLDGVMLSTLKDNMIEIPVDWKEMAERFNKRHGRTISLDGSWCTFTSKTSVEIQVKVVDLPGKNAEWLQNSGGFQFCFYKDENDKLVYLGGKSSYPKSPDNQTITVGTIHLYNILEDYISPYMEKIIIQN